VQAAARLTLLADAQRIEADDLLRQRFLRYQPQAEDLLQLDFMFFRLQPIACAISVAWGAWAGWRRRN
jgi:hypothetical protein